MNRRVFLSYATTGAVTAFLAPLNDHRDKGAIPSQRQFVTLIGKTYRARNSKGDTVRIRLQSVEQLKAALPGTESFSLLFQTRGGATLAQDVYSLRRRGSAACSLLIVPVLDARCKPEYQAVINRRMT